jgi:acetoacetate decarboxylase
MFKFEDDKFYLMPAHFGGFVHDPNEVLYYRDAVGLNFTYTTDGDRLADYLPEGFELLRPELNVSYVQNRRIDWMAGSGYNLIQIGVPALFQGHRDRVEGQYVLVILENSTAPILGGREQTGMPKIYADIEDLHINGQDAFTAASYEGNTFLRLEMTGAQPVEGQELEQAKPLCREIKPFGWRYIPKVGGPGADLSQPILYPQSLELNRLWIGSGAVQWTQVIPERLPFHWGQIIQALAELPRLEMAPVIMTQGVLILKPSQARVLE